VPVGRSADIDPGYPGAGAADNAPLGRFDEWSDSNIRTPSKQALLGSKDH